MNTTSLECKQQKAWTDGPTVAYIFFIFKQTIVLYIGLPVVILGLFTSLLCLYLFFKDRLLPVTTRRFLISIAITDILFLPLAAIQITTILLCNSKCRQNSSINMFALVSMARLFGNIVEMMRNWVMVIIGIERYLIICHPLKSKWRWNRRLSRKLLISTTVFSVLIRLPNIIDNAIYAHLGPTKLTLVHVVRNMHAATDTVFLTIVPMIILSFCGIRIAESMRSSKALEHAHCRFVTVSRHNEKRRVHWVILSTLVSFVTFMSPSVPLVIVQLIIWNKPDASCGVHYAAYVTSYLATLGTLLNSSANFFVYVCHSSKYRILLLKLFTCRKTPVLTKTISLETCIKQFTDSGNSNTAIKEIFQIN